MRTTARFLCLGFLGLVFGSSANGSERFDPALPLPEAVHNGLTVPLPNPEQVSLVSVMEFGRNKTFLTIPNELYDRLSSWGLTSKVLDQKNQILIPDGAIELIPHEQPLVHFTLYPEPIVCPDQSWDTDFVPIQAIEKINLWDVGFVNTDIFPDTPLKIGLELDFRITRFSSNRAGDATTYLFDEVEAAFKKEKERGHVVLLGKVDGAITSGERFIKYALVTEDLEGDMQCHVVKNGDQWEKVKYRVVWRASHFTRQASPFTAK